MKFKYEADEALGSMTLNAEPGVLDGYPPIAKMIVDRVSSNVSGDRIAAAGALAFANYISGQLIFERQLSSLTAELIERLLTPRWAHVMPLHPANLPIPRGSRTVYLGSPQQTSNDWERLELVERNLSRGSFLLKDRMIVSSNALVLDRVADPAHNYGLACLAVGVLLAEDLDIARIHMPSLKGLPDPKFNAVSELCLAVGLGVTR